MFNFDFALRSNQGIPLNWSLRGERKCFSFHDGTAQLAPQGSVIGMVYGKLNENTPATYTVSLEVRGNSGCRFRAYAEWALKADGGKGRILSSASSGSAWRQVPAEWTTFSSKIKLPADFTSFIFAFFADGNGKVEFRNLRITPDASATGIREAGGVWDLGPNGSVVTGESGRMIQVASGGESTLSGLSIVPGKRYKLEFQTVGHGKSGNETGFHYFTVKIRFNDGTTVEAPADDVGNQLQNKNFAFLAPDNANTLDITCTAADGATVRFSNFKLTEAPLRPEDRFSIQVHCPAALWAD